MEELLLALGCTLETVVVLKLRRQQQSLLSFGSMYWLLAAHPSVKIARLSASGKGLVRDVR